MAPAWILALQANFGSVDGWRSNLLTVAAAAGAGRVALCFRPTQGRLVNRALPGGDDVVLMAWDAGAPALDEIDWEPVYERYQAAVHDASEPFAADADAVAASSAQRLDVRRAGVYERAHDVIAGAQWRDPAHVAQWAAQLPPGEPVLVYCVYGHEVGRATALRLRDAGVDAHFLRGGIHDWAAAGRPLAAKPTSP
jgi:superoxide dismutase, Fe-Mn family